jgi:DNA-directed RNA polymerase subunit RPC12/RpoP
MKCVNCGYEFFGKDTLERGGCPACGKSLTVKGPTVDLPQVAEAKKDEPTQLDAQVATAINTRRIALALILAVVVSVGSALVSLMVSVFFIDSYGYSDITGARVLLSVWLLFAIVIMVFGLYFIIFNKRLTRPGGFGFWRSLRGP